jgi:hypothetical protein
MIASMVYLLCALTSTLCAVLLLRKYRLRRAPILFWSSLCFVGLALNNSILFVDLVLIPEVDLSVLRMIPAVVGFAVLLWGFVWHTD